MASYGNFESSTAIECKRHEVREAREQILKKAKEKYEKDEKRKELAKQRGEDTWMLPAVNQRVEKEQLKLKKEKKKKKDKKKKKEKEKKKKKRRKGTSSSESSSSEDEAEQWVEKSAKPKKPDTTTQTMKGPKLERDDWMNAPMDLVPTVTREDLINKRKKEKEEAEKQKQLQDKAGLHSRELNPYWKDGGSGLPTEAKPSVNTSTSGVGDSGLSWLRKSYQRCVQQAKEEGRSLEELAAERWGSLEKIQSMIREAEQVHDGRGERSYGQSRTGSAKNRFIRPGESDNSSSDFLKRKDSQSSATNYRRRSRSGERSRIRNSRSNSRDRYIRSRSRDRHRRSRSGSRDRRNRSRSRERRYRSRSRERRNKSKSRSPERYRNRRSRSRSRDRYRHRSRSNERNNSSGSSLRGRFMKPGEMENDSTGSRSLNSSSSRVPAWKKKEFQEIEQPKMNTSEPEKLSGSEKNKEIHHSKDADRKMRRRHSSYESSSSDSSSEDSASSSSSSEEETKHEKRKLQQPEVRILTEKEMNDLGAKIVRAEIMGNQAQADKLKAQLEAAREAKKNAPAPSSSGGSRPGRGGAEEEDDFVTLTRTDRSGMSRPVPDRQHPVEAKGGKRRKKHKVETHTGKQGERTKYFDDDDKFDLKTLVEREKLGTAEDQNQMFARLAGRSAEKTNDDFQVDDIFISKANQKQSASIEEERDRAKAIFEHRKMAASLEKCHFCFGNVPKHLIVAIGTKAYLCLPNNKSLTEGHCLIVPMQHIAASTVLDEDVWNEVQVFRKCLTKMFSEREEDVVFMETSMRLKQFPHMCIECVPMEKEVGDMAPIYFKKAIQESESEWSQNKKVVDLSQKDIRHAVPKGFPYFAVDFGNEGGFAHVIEDEQKFPYYFGKEIIGGMIDAEHRLWRKPPKENFDDQRRKVLRFAEMWKPYDWTQNINKTVDGSDSSDSD